MWFADQAVLSESTARGMQGVWGGVGGRGGDIGRCEGPSCGERHSGTRGAGHADGGQRMNKHTGE